MIPHSWHNTREAAVELADHIAVTTGKRVRVVEDQRDLSASNLSPQAQAMRWGVEVVPSDDPLVDMVVVFETPDALVEGAADMTEAEPIEAWQPDDVA